MDVEITSNFEEGNELLFAGNIVVNKDSLFDLSLGDNVQLTDGDNRVIKLERTVYKPVQSITCENVSVNVGKNSKAEYTVNPYGASCEEITFQSGDPEIATIDENGKITGISKGVVQMTVQIDDKISVFEVTVNENSGLNSVVLAILIIIGSFVVASFIVCIVIFTKRKHKNNKM